MKKGVRIYSAGGRQHEIITYHLTEEKELNADREYGLMKTTHSSTPFPQKEKPVDMVTLAARLEAEKSQIRVSINANTVRRSTRSDDIQTERNKSFNEQRKLFDEGEFTICKGRKLGEDFHPSNFDEHDLHFSALYAKIIERKSTDTQNFNELEKYCRDNNFKILTGVVPQ